MIPAIFKLIKNIKPRYDDDFIDRLNYAYTCSLIFIFMLVSGSKQYVGQPLQCWMNAEFISPWESNIESYCYVENTYYISENDQIPSPENRQDLELKHYQWINIYLMISLLFFIAPTAFWAKFSGKTNLNVSALIKNLSTDPQGVSNYLLEQIKLNKKRKDLFMGILPSSLHCNYLTSVLLFRKLLNFLNTSTQFYIMNNFVNTSYTFWGIGILNDLISNRHPTYSGNFPRVSYCDFMRRDDTSSKPMLFTVQCVLMINEFNEKLYIVLWFWFFGLTILNLGNLLYWLISSFVPAYSQGFIEAQLEYSDIENFNKADIPAFIDQMISRDGMSVLRLCHSNDPNFSIAECVEHMFVAWLSSFKQI